MRETRCRFERTTQRQPESFFRTGSNIYEKAKGRSKKVKGIRMKEILLLVLSKSEKAASASLLPFTFLLLPFFDKEST